MEEKRKPGRPRKIHQGTEPVVPSKRSVMLADTVMDIPPPPKVDGLPVEKLEMLREKLLNALLDDTRIQSAPYNVLAVGFGIVSDKLRVEKDLATAIVRVTSEDEVMYARQAAELLNRAGARRAAAMKAVGGSDEVN